MSESEKFRQIKTIFWITFLVGLGTFFCPFIEGRIRWEIYWEVFERFVLEGRSILGRFSIVFLLLLGTLIWLPIMGYAFYRYTVQKRYYSIQQRLVNYFLFSMGIMVYILPIYAVFDEEFRLNKLRFFDWGYWLLLVCTTILFICYLKVQKEQLIEEDLSEHLIMEDKN
jgi:ABC-type glycerol-3-phosphate transport system permease component